MDRRLDAAGLLVAASALLLVISLFLDWFGGGGSGGITAWRAFEVLAEGLGQMVEARLLVGHGVGPLS